jgi:transcriptional regulator with XRE-family HTH domain
MAILGYGQEGRFSLLCDASMKDKELNMLMGLNLRKLRLASKLTQEQLAERLDVCSGSVPKWEAGTKGIGKKVLVKLCKFFNVKPYAFYADEKMPHTINAREQGIVYKYREAEKLGVADLIEQFGDFMVAQAKNKQKAGNNDRPDSSRDD